MELLEVDNCAREKSGIPRLPKFRIKILGQMSLLMDRESSSALPLAMTADFDALISGPSQIRTILKDVLQKHGLEYDDLSSEIWLPSDATFISYFENYLPL